MSLKTLITDYTAFNEWANDRLLNWLEKQDEKTLCFETVSSFKTIDLTLQHILRTQKFWSRFIAEEDISNFDWSVKKSNPMEIIKELRENSSDMKKLFSTFSEEALVQKLNLDMSWAKNSLCRYEYMIHVVNHGTFHRGQIITMARSIGINKDVPQTDYNIFKTV